MNKMLSSSPCFKAGTKVLTKNGYVEIEKVSIGDEVKKGDLIGVGGTSIFDIEASNHVMLEVLIQEQNVDPSTVFNKNIDEVANMQTQEK